MDARDTNQEVETMTKEAAQARCLKCGLIWTPRVPEPRACPGCKSYHWREPRADETAPDAAAATGGAT